MKARRRRTHRAPEPLSWVAQATVVLEVLLDIDGTGQSEQLQRYADPGRSIRDVEVVTGQPRFATSGNPQGAAWACYGARVARREPAADRI
jgi:hypothetical protein